MTTVYTLYTLNAPDEMNHNVYNTTFNLTWSYCCSTEATRQQGFFPSLLFLEPPPPAPRSANVSLLWLHL